MATTYTGTPVLNTSITIPQDGDNANAASVNVASQALLDMQVYLLRTYGLTMQSTSPIRVRDDNFNVADTVLIYPIPSVVVDDGGTWKAVFTITNTTLSSTDVEGGGGFVANTWYYVYAYAMMSSCKFQISPVKPDIYGLYKDGTFSHKYICSFKTDGSAHIIGFNKYGNFTQYQQNLSIGGGNSTTQTSLSSDSYIPPITGGTMSRICKVLVQYDNSHGSPLILSMIPRSGASGYPFNIPALGVGTFICDIPADDMRKIYYRCSSNLNNPTILFTMYGYWE